MKTTRAAFLDRDGTLIEEKHYISDPDLVTVLPGVVEGLRMLREKGYCLYVISNQSGVGRGLIPVEKFWQVHSRIDSILTGAGVEIDEYLYCIHEPTQNCECRKPKTGLIPRRIRDRAIDFKQSIAVGDRICDLELGKNLQGIPYLILTGYGQQTLSILKQDPVKFEFRTAQSLCDVALNMNF